ncbi:MAG: alpha/beta hydrolase [Ferruginibacter sp.]|nr:alpha/beta hydrolase [Ferruginibacter sp.]
MNSPASIVFITGTFFGNNCWDEWCCYFESKGYTCMAPAWPHKEASPEELRNRHPDESIASNRLASLIDHYANIIYRFPRKPILIGHSLGGLIVQLLVQRGLAAAGVAVHSFPPQNARRLNFVFLKTCWEAMGFFNAVNKTYMPSFRKWKLDFANGMTGDEQKDLFYQYCIPESKLVFRDCFTSISKIDFNHPHAPLLFTAGTRDEVAPAVLNHNNYKKYHPGNSITDYKEFEGHNHLVFDGPACTAETDFILYWLQGIHK